MNFRAPLFWLSLFAGAGIGVSRIFDANPAGLIIGLTCSLILSFWKKIRPAVFLLAGFFGFWLYAQWHAQPPPSHLYRQLGEDAQTLILRGIVSRQPILRPWENPVWEFPLELEKIFLRGQWRPVSGKVLTQLPVEESNFTPEYGDRMEMTAFVYRPKPPHNLGQFDYRAYLENRGIFYLARQDPQSIQILERNCGNWFYNQALRLRRHMIDTANIPPWFTPEDSVSIGKINIPLANHTTIANLTSAMLFGYRDGLTEELENEFRKTGTLHLFAVSGQNVAVLIALLLILLKITGIIRWRWGWVIIPPVFLFCLSAGMESSAARTFVMITLVFIGWLIYRPVNPFNILGAAALILWIWNPHQLFEIGFQLSFAVVLAILLFTPSLTRWIESWNMPDPWIPRRLLNWRQKTLHAFWKIFSAVTAVSVSAWIGALPLTIGYFHSFAPVTPVANILIAPLAGTVVTLSALSVCLSWACTGFAVFFNQINWFLLQTTVLIIHGLAQIPGGHFYINPTGCLEPKPRITILHARGSFPTVIQTHSQDWLIDTGSEWDWQRGVDSFRRYQGIDAWDGVILSQPTKNHSGGLEKMKSDMPSHQIFESNTLHAGDVLQIGRDTQLRVLWPPADGKWKEHFRKAQDRSLVFLIEMGKEKILWAGDISDRVETEILKHHPDVHANILIQGRHHACQNLSTAWLKAIRPDYLLRPEPAYGTDYALDNEFWATVKRLNIRMIPVKGLRGISP